MTPDPRQEPTLRVSRVDADEIRAHHIADPAEDRRVAWLIAGIGMIILVVLSAGNVMALLRAQDAQRDQLALAECNRRVVSTVTARTTYTQQLNMIEEQRRRLEIQLNRNLADVEGNFPRMAEIRRDYANQLSELANRADDLRDAQAKIQYPDLSECGK